MTEDSDVTVVFLTCVVHFSIKRLLACRQALDDLYCLRPLLDTLPLTWQVSHYYDNGSVFSRPPTPDLTAMPSSPSRLQIDVPQGKPKETDLSVLVQEGIALSL